MNPHATLYTVPRPSPVALGKNTEWVWIDLLGGIWVFLGFTGLWMWWKSQTKRRDAARAKLMQEASRG